MSLQITTCDRCGKARRLVGHNYCPLCTLELIEGEKSNYGKSTRFDTLADYCATRYPVTDLAEEAEG